MAGSENIDGRGIIFDIRKYSVHDGPGIRTTVFLKGCPLRCLWCHNPEGLEPFIEVTVREDRCIRCGSCLETCKQGAIMQTDNTPLTDKSLCIRCGECAAVCYAEARETVGREMTVDQVIAEIEADYIFYTESGGGVTLSGGEPLLQPRFVYTLLTVCKQKGIHTSIDTCGYALWDDLKIIAEHTDLVLYDLKIMDDKKHREYTGVSNDIILRNLRELSRLGLEIVIRVPLIPGINDDNDNIRSIGSFAASLHGAHAIELLPYHKLGIHKYPRFSKQLQLSGIQSPGPERIAEISDMLTISGLTVMTRN